MGNKSLKRALWVKKRALWVEMAVPLICTGDVFGTSQFLADIRDQQRAYYLY